VKPIGDARQGCHLDHFMSAYKFVHLFAYVYPRLMENLSESIAVRHEVDSVPSGCMQHALASKAVDTSRSFLARTNSNVTKKRKRKETKKKKSTIELVIG
jgi:hypothetical protein